MTVDPYVDPPAERPPTPRFARLRPWLVIAIVLLLIGAWLGASLVGDRQDPTLQFPTDEAPAQPGSPEQPLIPDLPEE